MSHYGAELARLHHERFGMVAEAAATELLKRLAAAGVASGTVVDLAAGSGILSRAVGEAGFEAWGVDISADMLALARAEAPSAVLRQGSLWEAALPPCVAVAAVGEAFCYAADPQAGREALQARLSSIYEVLDPGGLILFDTAGPGRAGPAGLRRGLWRHGELFLGLEEREDERAREVTRELTLFVPEGPLYRRIEERHLLRLYAPQEILALCRAAGLAGEALAGYGALPLAPGWHAFAATRPR